MFKPFWSNILEKTCLLLVLGAVILLVVHPWADNFVDGLPAHWDPPVMTSWMAWSAHNILNGKFFLPDYNAPFFYPHSYTLAFSEPFWPQSFIYAIIYSLSQNPFLSFNLTSLFFWAFSGVCMFAFLREIPLSRGASYLGAVAFTIMPYHLAYYVEFNMLLSFIIPLGCLFFIRWLRSIRFRDAILFALVFWLSAISVIYYTIILIIPLFFLLISFFIAKPQLLRQKNFYLTGLTALGLTTVLCILYLYPYAILRIEGQYVRTLEEQALHSAQPLSYLRPLKTSVVHSFIKIPAMPVETVLFPGIIVTIIACIYWFRSRLVLPIRYSRIVGGLTWSRIVLWMVFWWLVIYGAYRPASIFFTASSFIIVPAILTVFFITLILLFLRRENGKEQVVLSGMGVGALASFILSLGPVVTVGPVFNTTVVGTAPMALLYKILPLFGVMRVNSRFSIVVLIFMITAGCFALDGIIKRYQKIWWIWVVLPFLLVGEAFFSKPYAFTDYREISSSKVQKILQQMPHRISIFQMPAGPRKLEAVAVINTVGRFNYSINGLSGFFPEQHYRLARLMTGGEIAKATEWLSQIFPEAYLVVDLGATKRYQEDKKMPFNEEALAQLWEEVARDEFYALYRLRPSVETQNKLIRRLRTDVLQENPLLSLQARAINTDTPLPIFFRVLVNGYEIGRYSLSLEWNRFKLRIPQGPTGNIFGEEVVLELIVMESGKGQASGGTPKWEVKDIEFLK